MLAIRRDSAIPPYIAPPALASSANFRRNSGVKTFLVALLLAVVGWFYFHEPAAHWRGIPAAQEPLQTGKDLSRPFLHDGYVITPLARYTITAVVLSRERYRNDREADLAPVDLALGWGPMSIAGVINELKVTQGGRWYEYRCTGEPPLEPRQMETHSANTHCLPDNTVRSELLAVKRHELVTLEGYLVEVTGDGGFAWRSSLTREDTGAHACEVMWVTRVEHRKL
jgi:hypothetical protein